MSRSYEMALTISKFDADKIDEIADAANKEWPGLGDSLGPELSYAVKHGCEEVFGVSEGYLCGGEDEDEFSRRLAREIFLANGGPCKLTVSCTYLEELPYDSYTFDETDYEELTGMTFSVQDEGADK